MNNSSTPTNHASPAELARIAAALRANPLFSVMSPETLSRLLGHVHIRPIKKGETLQALGQPTLESYLILDGCFQFHGDGERIIQLRSGLLGEEALLKMSAYATTVVAVEDSSVAVLPRHPLTEMIWSSRDLRGLMLASFSDRFSLKAGCYQIGQPPHGESPAEMGPALRQMLEQRQHYVEPASRPQLSKLTGWLLLLLLPLTSFFLLQGVTSLEQPQSALMVSILLVAVIMWIFHLMPDFVPALFGVAAIILFGLAPPEVALSGFASDSFFLALGIFGLSTVLTESGLSYRILLWLLKIGPANKLWYNLSLFITGLILTPLVPSVNGRTAIVTPFYNDLLTSIDADSARREGPRLGVSLIAGISLMTAMFLSSKSINFVVFGFLPLQEQSQYSWFHWFIAAALCGVVLMALFFLISALLFRNDSQPHIPRERVCAQAQLLGPIQRAEWAALAGLGLLLLSFLTISIHRIAIPWISLGIISVLLVFGFLGKNDFRRQIDWGFLVFLGGLIGLIASLQHLQLDHWLTGQLGWLAAFMKDHFLLFIPLLATTIFIVRLALPINATVVIFATLLIPTASHMGISAWLIGFLVLLFSESFVWPYQASYYLQFQQLAHKAVPTETGRILLFNLSMSAAKVLAVYASLPYWRQLGVL